MVLGMTKKRVFENEGEARPRLFVSRVKKKEMVMELSATVTSSDTMLAHNNSYLRCDG